MPENLYRNWPIFFPDLIIHGQLLHGLNFYGQNDYSIHVKASSVQVMSLIVLIMSDNVDLEEIE